jgi:hypothetical protein
MTPAMWLFEYHSLMKREREQVELQLKMLKETLVNVMGLNALRPVDSNGAAKSWDDMTDDEKSGYLPLVAWVGSPVMLKQVADQNKAMLGLDGGLADTTQPTPVGSYEDMVALIDENPDAIEEILGIDPAKMQKRANEIKVQLQQEQLKSLNVRDISEMDDIPEM